MVGLQASYVESHCFIAHTRKSSLTLTYTQSLTHKKEKKSEKEISRKEYIFVKLKKMFSFYLMVIKLYKGVMSHAPYPLQRYVVYGYI